MAIDGFIYFHNYDNTYLQSEFAGNPITSRDGLAAGFAAANDAHGLFALDDYSFDIEQLLNIGSQSTGAGAGKITFNPFSITRKVDVSSPILFQMACAGIAVKDMAIGLRTSSGGKSTGVFFLKFTFKLVAVKTIAWSHDGESPTEKITFEYGGLVIEYSQQKPDGSLLPPIVRGWNRVRNVAADANTVIT